MLGGDSDTEEPGNGTGGWVTCRDLLYNEIRALDIVWPAGQAALLLSTTGHEDIFRPQGGTFLPPAQKPDFLVEEILPFVPALECGRNVFFTIETFSTGRRTACPQQ